MRIVETNSTEVTNFIWTQKNLDNRRFLAYANLVWDTFPDDGRIAPRAFYLEDKLVGFLWLEVLQDTLEIVNVYVSEEARDQGIGRMIVEYVENLGRMGHSKEIVLDSIPARLGFYEKLNFKLITRNEEKDTYRLTKTIS